jgi:D-alanyl-D-alanine-carboxypeptidase/D-alanyl-D-alanine-endopeptidase
MFRPARPRKGDPVSSIVMPTQAQLDALVKPHLTTQPQGLAFAIGYASPGFSPQGNLYLAGNVANQFGQSLTLSSSTPFLLASVSKTFTATLYALLIRQNDPLLTLGNYISPNGPLNISSTLAGIPLDGLVNYTSGLPLDNVADPDDNPAYLPQPYSLTAMLSYLDASPPAVSGTGSAYTYSNLGFAIMSAVLASTTANPPTVGAFARLVGNNLLDPLGMQSHYFNRTQIASLPIGYQYNYDDKPKYWQIAPGWSLFPAYYGAGGLVASASDMLQWLLFNMGIVQNSSLTPLLPALQTPSTTVEAWGTTQLGLSWFITPASGSAPGVLWKDGDLDGCGSFITFLQSDNPGTVPSEAGVFVLVNGGDMTGDQKNSGNEVAMVLANDLLMIMRGQTPPADKSRYPRSVVLRPKSKPS